ncbi:MAG: amidohydrolase [Candidatus Eiseniibacteriota bacterium]|nr:MAG: amidohydrolase [Candidatus Eisenbacteria bacterium]
MRTPSENERPSSVTTFLNGNVLTMNDAQPRAEAIVVRDGGLAYVGTNRQAREAAKSIGRERAAEVDLGRATVTPGLTDCHVHLMNLGRSLVLPELCSTSSSGELLGAVSRRASQLPEGEWIEGFGWNETTWAQRKLPSLQELNCASPSNPLFLTRVDGHAALVNSLALAAAGIQKSTPDPQGGRIIRHGRTGEPTGVLIDTACDAVRAFIPEPARERKLEMLKAALCGLAAAGLTSAHDAWTLPDVIEMLFQLEAEGELPLRLHAMVPGDMELMKDASYVQSISGSSTPWVSVRSVKLLADGALGSRGALLAEPYSDDPQNQGVAIFTGGELELLIGSIAKMGLQPVVHAIGDAANNSVLEACERCLATEASHILRPRIEHAQLLLPSDVPRFAALGLTVSIQPAQLMSDIAWIEERVGPERTKNAFLWGSLLRSGTRLVSGSDCPIETPNPFVGIYAAVTRKDAQGRPEEGWFSQERLTREQALRSYTSDAAYAGFSEHVCGSLIPGKLADFTVIDRDPLSVSEQELKGTRVLATFVEGREVTGSLRRQ